jgi:hypothetical protein
MLVTMKLGVGVGVGDGEESLDSKRDFWAGFAVGLGLPPRVAHLMDGKGFMGLGQERTRQLGP